MVVFGRRGNPKSSVLLGPHEEESTITSELLATPQAFPPPVLRNFSYPTSIASDTRTPTHPDTSKAGQTTWAQLGEICNFSPDRPLPKWKNSLDDPFFFHNDVHQYHRLAEQENCSISAICFSQQEGHSEKASPAPKEDTNLQKRPYRGTLLGFPVSRVQNTSLISRIVTASKSKAKPAEEPDEPFPGDHILPRKSIVSKLKRTSLQHHKAAASFDASQLASICSRNPERPVSDLKTPSLSCRSYGDGREPQELPEQATLHSVTTSTIEVQELPIMDGKGQNISAKRRSKDGKSRWLSQIRDWVSMSEPSTQALKQHKKDAYKRAGVALDDPQGPAKLHIPVTALPAEAIKPYGPGPDPEEIVRRKAEQRKQARQSYTSNSGVSHRSRSSTSQHSSMSSLGLSSPGLAGLKKISS